LSYPDQGGTTLSWTYGQRAAYSVADGWGGTSNYDMDSILYAANYVFYSYYDEAQTNYYYYKFDGVGGYYVSNF
jgi:hypothetical protein